MQKKYSLFGFSLTEIIIVITLLGILGTIGYIYFTGNLSKSRDSARISDFDTMRTKLQLYQVEYQAYPFPDNPVDISFSGSTLWKQGNFGKELAKKLEGYGISYPKDPLYGNDYTYSILSNGQNFQLGGMLENYEDDPTSISQILVPNTYAAIGNNAYIIGNYNGYIALAKTGSLFYFIASPSIITSDISNRDILSILSNQKLSFNGFNNLPHTYSGVTDTNGGFYYSNPVPVVFSGSLETLSSYSGVIDINKNIKKSYIATILENIDRYSDFIQSSGNKTLKSLLTQDFSIRWDNYLNCADIKDAGADTGDHFYTIDSDGLGPIQPINVFCNMSVDGGGWTRVGDNHITNGDFPSGSGITTQWGSNPNNTIIPMQSPINSGYVVRQYGNGGWPEWQNAQTEYEVHFNDFSKVKAGYEIWMSLWVADAWDGGFPTVLAHNPVPGYLFHNRIFYTDSTNTINGPVETLDTKVVNGKTWKLQRVRTKVLKTPSDFHWYIGYDAEKVTDLYFTGVRLELFYR